MSGAQFPTSSDWANLEESWKGELDALQLLWQEVQKAVTALSRDPQVESYVEAYRSRLADFDAKFEEVRRNARALGAEAQTLAGAEAKAKYDFSLAIHTILDLTSAAVRHAGWTDPEVMQNKFKIALNIPVIDVKYPTPSTVSGSTFKGNIKYNQLKDLCTGYDGTKHPLVPNEFLRRYEQSLGLSTSGLSGTDSIPDDVKVSTIRLLLTKNALMWHDNHRRRADSGYLDSDEMMKNWAKYQQEFLREFKSRVTFAEQQKIKARLAHDAKNLTDRPLLNACVEAALAITAEKPKNDTFRDERDFLTVDLFVSHCDALIRSKLANLASGRQIKLLDVHMAIEQAETQRELAKNSQVRSSVLLAELEEPDDVLAVQPSRARQGQGGNQNNRPGGDDCFFCHRKGHMKFECRSFEAKHPDQFRTYNQRRNALRTARQQRKPQGNAPNAGRFQPKGNAPFQANAVEVEPDKEEPAKEPENNEMPTVATVSNPEVNFDGVVHQIFAHRPGPMSQP